MWRHFCQEGRTTKTRRKCHNMPWWRLFRNLQACSWLPSFLISCGYATCPAANGLKEYPADIPSRSFSNKTARLIPDSQDAFLTSCLHGALTANGEPAGYYGYHELMICKFMASISRGNSARPAQAFPSNHLVMTNSSPWKDAPFLSSVNHLFLWAIYTMAMLNNQVG